MLLNVDSNVIPNFKFVIAFRYKHYFKFDQFLNVFPNIMFSTDSQIECSTLNLSLHLNQSPHKVLWVYQMKF